MTAYKRLQKAALLCTIAVTAVTIAGCADFTHFNSSKPLKPETAVFLDAKQRGVFGFEHLKKSERIEGETGEKDKYKYKLLPAFCAEPPPDTVSALAATLRLDYQSGPDTKATIANTIAEGVSQLGARTVAIQALRDSMYRICEAYALGGITELGMETMLRRFQSTMVTLLSLDALTGADNTGPGGVLTAGEKLKGIAKKQLEEAKREEAKAIQVLNEKNDEYIKIGGDARLNVVLAKITSQTEKISKLTIKRDALQDESAKKKVQNMIDSENKTFETLKKEKSNLMKIKGQKTTAKRRLVGVMKEAKESQNLLSRTIQNTADLEKISETSQPGSEQGNPLAELAPKETVKAIEKIVLETIAPDFGTELCATLVGNHPREQLYSKIENIGNSVLGICLAVLWGNTGLSAGSEEKKVRLTAEQYVAYVEESMKTGSEIEDRLERLDKLEQSKTVQ